MGSTEVIRKVEKCGEALTKWSKDCFGNVRTELEKKKRELARAEKVAIQRDYSNDLIQLKKDINSLMDKEERMWRQRSRTLYLRDGDRNTRFFHCRATQRRRKNLIMGLKISQMTGALNQIRLQPYSLNIINNYSQPPI